MVDEFGDPIYAGLVCARKVESGGDWLFHIVINADNFHALQAVLLVRRGKVHSICNVRLYKTDSEWTVTKSVLHRAICTTQAYPIVIDSATGARHTVGADCRTERWLV